MNYPSRVATLDSFNLPEFMLTYFNRVDFGGDLFTQWPVGIRFDIGLERVSRAVELFEFTFGKADDCVVVSQDWPTDSALPKRFTALFKTPGVFSSAPSHFQTAKVFPFGESEYRLTWTRLSPTAFDATRMFQAIANRERGGIPSASSGVYIIEPLSRIIMHMYDDRGLDVIAHDASTLLPLYRLFGDWVLDHDRQKIALRFKDMLPTDED